MPIQLDLIDFVNQQQRQEPAGAIQQALTPTRPDLGFHSDVSRAVYSAAIMRPIFELEAKRFPQGEPDHTSSIGERLDLLSLAFGIMDVISELVEYQSGATRSEILERVLPLAQGQAMAQKMAQLTDTELLEIVGKVFDHLVNRQNRYLPFHSTWFDATAGQYKTRRFWLIKTVYTGEGNEALFTLTEEGYTAYFGLHETSALDATAIGNLRIKLLIERGNVDDAISVADSNRKQCARKALEVRNIRRQIRRNINAVVFANVRSLAEEGVDQATTIQKEGRRLHNMVIESLTVSQNDRRHETKLLRLAEMLEHLNSQLMNLTTELQQLPDDYDTHSFKLFRRRNLGAFPSMEEVMHRLIHLREKDAAQIGKEFIARIDAPAQPALFDPAAVIEACDRALDRQNAQGDRNQTLHEVDGITLQRFAPDLTEELMRQAFTLIQETAKKEGKLLLSSLLAKTVDLPAATRNDTLLPVAVAMAIFQCTVERRLATRNQIRLSMLGPESRIRFDLCPGYRYHGHELCIHYLGSLHSPKESS